MVHVTDNGYVYLLNLITVQIVTWLCIVHQLGGAVRLPWTHLSTRCRAEGVGWPHHRLGVHHSGWIHHPHRAHLWRLQHVAQRWQKLFQQWWISIIFLYKFKATMHRPFLHTTWWTHTVYLPLYWPCHIPSCLSVWWQGRPWLMVAEGTQTGQYM